MKGCLKPLALIIAILFLALTAAAVSAPKTGVVRRGQVAPQTTRGIAAATRRAEIITVGSPLGPVAPIGIIAAAATRAPTATPVPTNTPIPTAIPTATPLPTATPDIRVEAIEVTYDQLMRDADTWQDKPVTFTGKVVQVGSDWWTDWIRVVVDSEEYSSDAVFVIYDHDHRILEDDSVTVYGMADGRVDYKTVLGASTSAPRVEGSIVTVN